MSGAASTAKATPRTAPPSTAKPARIISIDALRGFVMFAMIFVNDLAGAGKIVPDWMVHFSDRHKAGSGMTFVDLVFPAFLFLVGMSIPFALGSRVSRGEPLWKTLLHIVVRTVSLLFIGVLMVNESPSTEKMGWSSALWQTLLYVSAIFAFCDIAPRGKTGSSPGPWRIFSVSLRILGLASLVFLAFAFVGPDGHRIITLSPFAIHHEWWGILGLIGWAYLVGVVAFLLFGQRRTALLGCVALLFCLFPADRSGAFNGIWLARHVGFGETLGSQASITVAGVLLSSILLTADTSTVWARLRFTLLFIAGMASAALLLNGLYGINKNSATPSWCLCSCAITAALWMLFHIVADLSPVGWIASPLAVAGQNVLLAYLLSDLLPSALGLFHLADWYWQLSQPSLAHAVARSAGYGVLILCATAGLNRLGFRLKL